MRNGKPQLRYTSLHDMCQVPCCHLLVTSHVHAPVFTPVPFASKQVTCAPHEVVQCICCLRFLARHDRGTIRVAPGEYNIPSLVHAGMDSVPALFLHQAALLQRPRTHLCFICEPHIKRAQQEHSTGNTSAVACSFVQDALDCVLRGKMAHVDFFRVLKGCICLAAHVRTPHQVHYHPLRSAVHLPRC